jgi:hypothetical protein
VPYQGAENLGRRRFDRRLEIALRFLVVSFFLPRGRMRRVEVVMIRTRSWFVFLASMLAACAQADPPGGTIGTHDGGTDTSHADVKPGTDTEVPGDDTAGGDDTRVGTDSGGGKDTGGGSDTSTCTIPTGKVCETWPQCGCPAGKNCDVTKVDGTRACTTAGGKKLHDKCTGYNQCDPGMSCIAGNCLQLCNKTGDCPSGACVNITSGTPPSNIPGYLVCFEDCDPISPSSTCGAGACNFDASNDTVCTTAGTGTGAGGCSSTTPFSCAPGYVCITTSTSTNECAKWCRVGVSSDCTGGTLCSSLTTPPTKGGVEYGVCN